MRERPRIPRPGPFAMRDHLLTRLGGKRELAQINVLDLAVLLETTVTWPSWGRRAPSTGEPSSRFVLASEGLVRIPEDPKTVLGILGIGVLFGLLREE
jgi:hypothetical protein